MRELTGMELNLVSGGQYQCDIQDANNAYYGIVDPSRVGNDLIGIYEGVVMFTSHVIERVATAW
jgi:hypothetical protein